MNLAHYGQPLSPGGGRLWAFTQPFPLPLYVFKMANDKSGDQVKGGGSLQARSQWRGGGGLCSPLGMPQQSLLPSWWSLGPQLLALATEERT